jgi:hypothetical protein
MKRKKHIETSKSAKKSLSRKQQQPVTIIKQNGVVLTKKQIVKAEEY